MFCPKCGKEIGQDDKFCWNCGAENKKFVSGKEQQSAAQPAQPRPSPTAGVPATPSVPAQPARKKRSVPLSPEKRQSAPVVPEVPAVPALPVKEKESVQRQASGDEFDYRSLPSEKEKGIKGFYIVDFLSRLTGEANIPLCIYLVLNVIIIGLICSMMLALPIQWGLLSGVILYAASVTIALSPIGEFLLRNQNNCREIMDVATVNRIKPIFCEVYYKAKQKDPSLSNDIRLFMNDDASPNAFATGRKTVCITKGMLQADDETIKAVLAHEFGHLSHRDTDRILVVAIGNMVITGIATMFQIAVIINQIISTIVAIFTRSEEGIWYYIFSTIASVLSLIFVRGFMKVWSALGTALCMKTSRGNEFQADHFAFELGYGETLAYFLGILPAEKPKGLFASLANSHPDPEDRVERLLELVEEQR